MRDTTLCFLVNGNPISEILLGLKKRGFGKDKLNGFGGKLYEWETIEEAVLRELEEEAGIQAQISDLKKVGELTFLFPPIEKEHDWNQTVHVYFVHKWNGEAEESGEMKPVWTKISELPFDRMWDDDKFWLPKVLQGKKLKGRFIFKEDNHTIKEFELKETNF